MFVTVTVTVSIGVDRPSGSTESFFKVAQNNRRSRVTNGLLNLSDFWFGSNSSSVSILLNNEYFIN